MADSVPITDNTDEGKLSRQHWKSAALACMADYIDAGAIVASSAGLAVWVNEFGITDSTLGLLGALGTNAISYAVGALVGGRLGDLFGRKSIYKYDLLFFCFAMLWVVFAQNTWMLFAGLIMAGLAVGADVPTSWALVGEMAPARSRGKLMGLTSVFWSMGPVVTLMLAYAFSPFGLLGIRLVFAHLLLVALVTWFLRRGMTESRRWRAAMRSNVSSGKASSPSFFSRSQLRELFTRPYSTALLFIFTVHMLGSLVAGTYGFFFPYILRAVGGQSQATSVGMQALGFFIGALVVVFVFMPLIDRTNRRALYGTGSALTLLAFLLVVFFSLTSLWVALLHVVLFSVGAHLWQEQFYRVWCQELFPTALRSTAQGIVIGTQKIGLGIWSAFVPALVALGIQNFALIMLVPLFLTGLLGVVFMPDTARKSLEEIQLERGEAAGSATTAVRHQAD